MSAVMTEPKQLTQLERAQAELEEARRASSAARAKFGEVEGEVIRLTRRLNAPADWASLDEADKAITRKATLETQLPNLRRRVEVAEQGVNSARNRLLELERSAEMLKTEIRNAPAEAEYLRRDVESAKTAIASAQHTLTKAQNLLAAHRDRVEAAERRLVQIVGEQ